ncbi:Lrp/AsnC family transcriptional regulator [Candidatus Micrarchaeota archaeon]|nr:Lrp/AsnC family transcriptional regulator [Candidatus Micrarchaeota archaeon]
MLDSIDEKIISELDNDARKSSSQVAKRLHLAKSVVNYRIKRLERGGIIKRYYAVIDSYRLGYSSYRIYVGLRNASPVKEKEMIDYLAALSQTRWVGLIKGRYNLGIVFLIKNQSEFVALWEEFASRYREYFSETTVGISKGLERYRLPFAKKHLKTRAKIDEVGVGEIVKIDPVESKLLNILSGNAKLPLFDIAKQMQLSPAAINYRIKQLVKKKVLLGFRPILDMEKLGYTLYKVDFNLKTLSGYERMRKFATEQESVFCLVKTIGAPDVELEIYAKSTAEFYNILDLIRLKFEDVIVDYNFLMYADIIKFRYAPYTEPS